VTVAGLRYSVTEEIKMEKKKRKSLIHGLDLRMTNINLELKSTAQSGLFRSFHGSITSPGMEMKSDIELYLCVVQKQRFWR
jgi:hypothetical protein